MTVNVRLFVLVLCAFAVVAAQTAVVADDAAPSAQPPASTAVALPTPQPSASPAAASPSPQPSASPGAASPSPQPSRTPPPPPVQAMTAAAKASQVARRLKVVVTAVDPQTFHVVAYPADAAAPPSSPFVVETTPLPSAVSRLDAEGNVTVDTLRGELAAAGDGRGLRLSGRNGMFVVLGGSIALSGQTVAVTLPHAPGERFYGAGNEKMNTAGDLTHPSGMSIVSNGATRVPFLWLTGGWSCLIANNQTGIAWNDDRDADLTIAGDYADVYLSVAPDGYGLLDAYSRLTGRAPIPPRWTFGFMMSRWGYVDAADVEDKWHQFRDRKIPVDTFIYDYDWFTNDFDFNTKYITPDSLAKMHALGLRFVGIRKPRVSGVNLDYADAQAWTRKSWLGNDLRFDIPAARYWWWNRHVPLIEAGVDGWWNDEAEQTDDEFFQMAQTEEEGWRSMNDRRSWSLNRAFSPGMQRLGVACWTGDISSAWETLANQPGTMLNWSLAGMPYSGQDIGGFRGTPEPELYARWIEEGVYVPVMRAHCNKKTVRWPWAFGDDALTAVTKAIDLRYRLIPYYYTFAWKTATTGAPVMRPLVLEFPDDPQTYNREDEWLVGDRLLAAPLLTPGGARDVYLPAGGWFDFNTGAAVAGGQTIHVQAALDAIPAYVRAGSIVPLGPVLQSTSLGVEDPLEVRIYPGADADFTLYEDDGDTYAYQHGEFSTIPMHWDDRTRTFTVGARKGVYAGMQRTRNLILVLPGGGSKSVVYTGHELAVHLD